MAGCIGRVSRRSEGTRTTKEDRKGSERLGWHKGFNETLSLGDEGSFLLSLWTALLFSLFPSRDFTLVYDFCTILNT